MHWFIILMAMVGLSMGLSIRQTTQTQQQPTLNLYYETMCPDCQDFASRQLCPAINKIGKYFQAEFVPYGNAETSINNKTGEISIDCQHGPQECEGNRIQSCALKHFPYDLSTKFICCMEASNKKTFDPTGSKCASRVGIDIEVLKTCANGPEGNQLHYLNGVKTAKLDPQPDGVPWILFNGVFNQADMVHAQDDLVSVLCKYMPDPKPHECNEVER